MPYIQKRVHAPHDLKSRPGWMRNRLFADGMITNWGTHLNDIAQWGNDTERTGPVEVKATGKFHDGKVWNVLESFDAWYRFANGVEMFYQMGEPHVRFEGDKGWIQVNYFKTAAPRPARSQQPGDPAGEDRPGELHFPLRSESGTSSRPSRRAAGRWKTRRSASARLRSATWRTSRSSSAARRCAGIR